MGASSYLSIRAGDAAKGVPCNYLESFYHGFATFLSFILCGSIPLISFLIPRFYKYQFCISCIMTAIALFSVGALRMVVVGQRWLQGGLEMLLIGGVASIIGYTVGNVLTLWFNECLI